MNSRNITTTIFMVLGLLAILALVAFVYWGAKTTEDQNVTNENTVAGDFEQREAIESDFDERVDELEQQIAEMQIAVQAKLDDLSDASVDAWYEAKANMDTGVKTARERLEDLQAASKDTWVELQINTSASIDALEKMYLEAKANFLGAAS